MRKINRLTMDIEMVLGDTGTFSIAPKIDGESVFIDGDKIEFRVRDLKTGRIVISKDVTTFEDGVAVIPILPSDTIGLDSENYVYTLKLTNTNDPNRVYTLLPNTKAEAMFTLKGAS